MKKISIYQVDETPIGKGGMGRVLKGVDPDGRQVAIKEILPEFAADLEVRTRTEREVDMLQRLDHDSIVKVFDQFPLNDNFYIVMEFVDGLNVEQYVEKYGPIPVKRATRYMAKILDAMQFIHEKGFIHRDLKPSNIMIRNDERICILDFGIAKDLNSNGQTMTIFGTILGSDGYMSPEQANGFSVDRRGDIYALGCVFYFMLTGHHAYNTLASDFETAQNILNTPFPKLSKYSNHSFPKGLQKILDHATDNNMNKRYQSCREFRNDLLKVIGITVDDPVSEVFITVGREDCDILVNPEWDRVSRNHLDVTYRQFTGGRYYTITDHSTNGTIVNNRRLGHGQATNIPADGPNPQVLLACDAKCPLDWNTVKQQISMKLQERERQVSSEGPTIPPVMPPSSDSNRLFDNPPIEQLEGKQKPSTFVRILFYVLSVLSPIGWILYFVYRKKNKKLAKICCIIAFISFGIIVILSVINEILLANGY